MFRIEFFSAASQDAGNGRRKCSKRALTHGKLEHPNKKLSQCDGEMLNWVWGFDVFFSPFSATHFLLRLAPICIATAAVLSRVSSFCCASFLKNICLLLVVALAAAKVCSATAVNGVRCNCGPLLGFGMRYRVTPQEKPLLLVLAVSLQSQEN